MKPIAPPVTIMIEVPVSDTIQIEWENRTGPSPAWLARMDKSIAGKRIRRTGPTSYVIWEAPKR